MNPYIPAGISALKAMTGLGKPYKLTFAVTYACNSRCSYCGIWKRKPGNELSLEEIREIGRKSPFIKWLNLTGGEPFLRKDLPEIVFSFPRASLLNLTTNGLVRSVPDTLERIREGFKGRIVLTVSLDGPPEVHDRIRGIPGNWEKAVEILKEVRGMGIESYFGFTIGSMNSKEFWNAVDSVKAHGFSEKDFHLNIYHVSKYYGNSPSHGWEGDAVRIAEEMSRIKKSQGLLGLLEYNYLSRVAEYIRKGKTPIPCTAVKSSVFLDPMGNLHPCTMWGKSLGNVRDFGYSILEILNQEESMETRESIKKRKCPNCWTPCEAFPSIIGSPLRLML